MRPEVSALPGAGLPGRCGPAEVGAGTELMLL